MGNTNGSTRNMVVNSFADLDDTPINQGTSESRQPQLCFHNMHGQNVGLNNGGRIARRKESFCKGLAFSNRPITVDEVVCIRLTEVASNWSGVMRFGVTNVDPETYRGSVIPKFACPDLTSKDGYWAKALPERYSVEGHIVHFYVTADGELFYGINGMQKGMFLSGINVRSPLWVIVDIYGNSVAVEFIDANDAKVRAARALPTPTRPAPAVPAPAQPSTRCPSTIASTSSQETHATASNTHSYSGVDLDLMLFHRVCGRHIALNGLRTLATRSEQEYTQGYVFTERPVRIDEKVLIQIVGVQQLYSGGLAFGVTCCDPQTLRNKELPDDSSDLIEMPDYWVGIKDVALQPAANTVLQFWITQSGEIRFQKDNKAPRTIMFVDATLPLYMYFDVYGSTQIVKLLGCCPVSRTPSRPPAPAATASVMPTRVALPLLPATSTRGARRSEAASPQRSTANQPPAPATPGLRVALDNVRLNSDETRPALPPRRSTSAVDDLLSLDSPNGGPPALAPAPPTINSVNASPPSMLAPTLPSRLPITTPPNSAPSSGATSTSNPFQTYMGHFSSTRAPPPVAPRSQMMQIRSAPQMPPSRPPPPPPPISSMPTSAPLPTAAPQFVKLPPSQPASTIGSGGDNSDDESDECTVCMNAKVNCVIYRCGHMCMCFDCATTLKNQKGECPICRNTMEDVIKCFKS